MFDKLAEDKCKRVQNLYSKYHRLLLKDFAVSFMNKFNRNQMSIDLWIYIHIIVISCCLYVIPFKAQIIV